MGLNKRLHHTPLVPLIVLLLVCSALSYIQIKSLFASSVNAHFVYNYPTLSPLRPNTTSPPFFSSVAHRPCKQCSKYTFLFALIFLARIMQYCLAAVDVAPFPSLLRMSVDHQARYVDRQLSFHWIRRGCRVANKNLPWFQLLPRGMHPDLLELVQIHSGVLILLRVLQQLTMG